MQKKIYIKDVAEVITGYTFRTALRGKEGSSLFVLQAKCPVLNLLNQLV